MNLNHHTAYGGAGWSPRNDPMAAELGRIWAGHAVGSEWAPLRAVLLHRPGTELAASRDPQRVQMLAPLDLARAQHQHDKLAEAYRRSGVAVHPLEPQKPPPPNQMFVADLMFMTPEGAVVGRPASTVRAGEERHLARKLADLGIPILRSIRGRGTFEGADAMWVDAHTVLVGVGFRTNTEGAAQLTTLLAEMRVTVIPVPLAAGAMHLMGALRIIDRDLAAAWPNRLAPEAVAALEQRGYRVQWIPDMDEALSGMALNGVTLGPRRMLVPAGNPRTRAFFETLGVSVQTVAVDELAKAAGAIGCLTGILAREGG